MSSINQQLSLFVPYMFANITEARVSKVFSALLLGEVSRVDFVPKTDKNGKSYNAAYIHFNLWYDSDTVAHFQERVTNSEKEARIVYDEPWYWIVLENTAIKMQNAQDRPKAQETEFVSSDYAAILENKLAAVEKRLEELEECSWERIAELEERVADLEQDELMQSLVDEEEKMPELVQM